MSNDGFYHFGFLLLLAKLIIGIKIGFLRFLQGVDGGKKNKNLQSTHSSNILLLEHFL